MVEYKSDVRRVLWWGAAQAEYAWLQQRVASHHTAVTAHIELTTADQPFEQIGKYAQERQCDRIIVVCPNRWDYSAYQLQQVVIDFPEIPVALATGDWWLGWRRTGMGHLQNLSHISLPWYRWWDGWVQWLDGTIPAMFGPFPTDRVVTLPATQGLDVIRGLEAVGKQAAQVHSVEENRWVIWDDSQLATWLGWEQSVEQAIEQIGQLQARNPRATLWIAWTMPTWEVVERLNQAGLHFELLAKPYCLSWSSAALART